MEILILLFSITVAVLAFRFVKPKFVEKGHKPISANVASASVSILAFVVILVVLIPGEEIEGQEFEENLAIPQILRNSPWNGAVRPAEAFLKTQLRDPGSVEYVEWGETYKNAAGTFLTWCKYRSKNGFGGYVLQYATFELDEAGLVLKHEITELQ